MKGESQLSRQMEFLSQEQGTLRGVRGQDLRDTLGHLGYAAYFKAAGTSLDQYCAEEFGLDLR